MVVVDGYDCANGELRSFIPSVRRAAEPCLCHVECRARPCQGNSFLFTHVTASLTRRFQGLSIFRPIIYGNTAVVLTQKERDASAHPDHTHRWTLALRSAASSPDSDQVGGGDDLSYFIKRVTFRLHETYPNPSRSM